MNGANPFISDFDNRSLLSVAMDSDKKEFAAILCAGMIYRVLKKLPNYHDGFSSLKAAHESGHTNLLLLKLLGIIQGFTLLENNGRWKKELCASLYTCIDNEDIIMESLEFRAQRAALFAKGGGLYNYQNGCMR